MTGSYPIPFMIVLAIVALIACCVALNRTGRITRALSRRRRTGTEPCDDVDGRPLTQEGPHQAEVSDRSLLDSLVELVLIADREGLVIDANEAAQRVFGDRDDLIGVLLTAIVDSDKVSPDDWARRLTAAAAGEPQQFESWARAGNGRSFPVDITLGLGEFPGEPVLIAAARDISDRKRAEIELTSAEAHFRGLVESSPFGIIGCDFHGAILEMNPAASRLLGPVKSGGPSLPELTQSGDRERMRSALAEIALGAGSIEIDIHAPAAGGEVRLLTLTLSRVDAPGIAPPVQGIVRDITVERQHAQQLRRVERFAGMATLVGGVAHELNNPLTAIQSFAELLLLEERSSPDREALETVRREAARAARIVSDLRLVARGSQEDAAVPFQGAVDVNDAVRQVVRLRAYALGMENIEVREELDRDLSPVAGDRGQLEQAILNIVVNASQAMETRPERRLLVRTRREGTRVAIEISDTGIGIPPKDLENIFDPFWTTRSPGVGTGLGLSLVHSIVSDHAGMIRVHSQPGEGTTFVISLPAAGNERSIGQSRPLPAMAERPLRLLLVEDEAAIRRVLQHYLQRRGHTVDVACEGGEALALIAKGATATPYDVIVSDLRMPGIGGERLFAELQARDDDFDRRVIFISGDAAGVHTKKLIDDARVPILYKPFALEDLSTLIEKFAERAEQGGTARPPEDDVLTRQVG